MGFNISKENDPSTQIKQFIKLYKIKKQKFNFCKLEHFCSLSLSLIIFILCSFGTLYVQIEP